MAMTSQHVGKSQAREGGRRRAAVAMSCARLGLPERRRYRSLDRGVTLVEIVLSMAILAITLSILAQHVQLAARAAGQATAIAYGQVYAQSLMAEFVSGAAVPTSVAEAEHPTDPDFVYSVDVQPVPGFETSLLNVRVVVTENRFGNQPGSYELTRLVSAIPPAQMAQAVLDAEANAAAAAETSTSSTTSSTSGTGGTSGSTGSGSTSP